MTTRPDPAVAAAPALPHTTIHFNEHGQPVGEPVVAPLFPAPTADVLEGTYCRLEHIQETAHGEDLFHHVYGPRSHPQLWTYLSTSNFATFEAFVPYLRHMAKSTNPYFFVIIDNNPERPHAVGTLSISDIDLVHGVGEVGWVVYSAELRRTRVATEAQYLLARYVFDTLGYRRLQWRCNALNAPSVRAAQRLGYTFEGTFRCDQVNKGRSRDTAFFSLLKSEWPERRRRLEAWLAPDNFDADGKQKHALSASVTPRTVSVPAPVPSPAAKL